MLRGDTEAQLLGLCISDVVYAAAAERCGIVEDDFYLRDHRTIWRAIAALLERGAHVDPVLVNEEVSRRARADQADWVPPRVILQIRDRGLRSTASIAELAAALRGQSILPGAKRACALCGCRGVVAANCCCFCHGASAHPIPVRVCPPCQRGECDECWEAATIYPNSPKCHCARCGGQGC
jgi:DnaB-like helicase N terminal domain